MKMDYNDKGQKVKKNFLTFTDLCANIKSKKVKVKFDKGSDIVKISDIITDMILDMFDDDTPTVQIKRNDLAAQLGCVPSQINYVITSRFTAEQGYQIESRRGGGGYIMITRATNDNAMLSLINSIGSEIDEKSARTHIYNLRYQQLISDKAGKMMLAVVSDGNFKGLSDERKNKIRANQLKQMLIAYLN